MPHPLRTRAFRLLFIGRTLSLIGDAVIPTALSLAVYLATGSTGALALVLGCAMVPKLLLLPLGGVVGDRFNARTVALTTDLVRCATQLFVGAELLGGSPALWQIALAEAVGGAAGAFAMPTASPLIRGTVAESGLLRANSLMAVVNSATRLGGPALAGLLILTAGPGWAFVLDGATFAVSAALLSAVEVRHVPVPRRSLLTDLKEGWGEVRSRDWYWTSLIGHATWNGAAAVLMTVGPALFLRELGGKGVWVALLQTGAVGLLLGSLLALPGPPPPPDTGGQPGPRHVRPAARPAGRPRARRAHHRRVRRRPGRSRFPRPGLGQLGPVGRTGTRTGPGHLVRLAALPRRDAARLRPGPARGLGLGCRSAPGHRRGGRRRGLPGDGGGAGRTALRGAGQAAGASHRTPRLNMFNYRSTVHDNSF